MPSPPPSPSERFAKRDRAILRHIALYGVGLSAVVSRLFFGGKQSGHVLKRFASSSGPLAAYPRSLPGGLTYYRLSAKGSASLSLSAERAKPIQGAALDLAIGSTFFCCLEKMRRYRVKRHDLFPLFGKDTPQGNVFHVVSDESGEPVLYRIYQAQGSVSHTVQRVREHIAEARAKASMKPYVVNGFYGIAILLPTSALLKPVAAAIGRHDLENLAPIVCGLGPTAATLASELRSLKS